ncbi:transposase [Streptomyces sp. WAC07061]|uniref:transposase n=1 Tax=Streptomyces sp. WAC07061 TaxID=2487410 RepID=UPI0034D2281E
MSRRRDGLFEVADALLCADGPVTPPVDLTLLAEHRRGHGALYGALNEGRIDADRLRRIRAALPQLRRPARPGGRRKQLAAAGRRDSFVVALESGRTSWCQLLDAVRLGPEDDVAEVTAGRVRRVLEDLVADRRWREGDPDILIVFDAGYPALPVRRNPPDPAPAGRSARRTSDPPPATTWAKTSDAAKGSLNATGPDQKAQAQRCSYPATRPGWRYPPTP